MMVSRAGQGLGRVDRGEGLYGVGGERCRVVGMKVDGGCLRGGQLLAVLGYIVAVPIGGGYRGTIAPPPNGGWPSFLT